MAIVKEYHAVTGEFIGANDEDIGNILPSYPMSISSRQFYQFAAKSGKISQAEALDVIVNRVLPPAIDTYLNSLSADAAFDARMLMLSASTFDRNHPLVPMIATLFDMSNEELDEFWYMASLV